MPADYPPAPWHLQGPWLVCPALIPLKRARAFIPPEQKIIPVLPGLTLGGLLLASYEAGSTLQYHELAVLAGFVWCGGRPGLWVSHIYVDNERSVAGGRQLWGLPKEWADFQWQAGRDTTVTIRLASDAPGQFTIRWQEPQVQVLLPLAVAACGTSDMKKVRWFRGFGAGFAGLTRPKIQIPASSPFSELRLERAWFGLAGRKVNVWLGGIRQIKA